MSNALGELFGNIAAAIREKTGEEGTMKPIEFPEKIAAIETGGGGSGGKVYNATKTLQSINGQRVNIDFGFVPDFIIMYAEGMARNTEQGNIMAFGVSRKLKETYGTSITMSRMKFENSMTSMDLNSGTCIDDAQNINQVISDASATGFYLGYGTPVTKNYAHWRVWAFGGLC